MRVAPAVHFGLDHHHPALANIVLAIRRSVASVVLHERGLRLRRLGRVDLAILAEEVARLSIDVTRDFQGGVHSDTNYAISGTSAEVSVSAPRLVSPLVTAKSDPHSPRSARLSPTGWSANSRRRARSSLARSRGSPRSESRPPAHRGSFRRRPRSSLTTGLSVYR